MNRSLILLLSLGLATAPVAFGYKEVPPPEKVVLPPAKSPAESLAAITVPAGLEVELVAAEPKVMDPVDIAWGPDGKMWVVEMADYPDGMDGKGKPGGRIRFLESTKGDGMYDKSTLFADGLNYPTSVLPWRDGVLVSGAPALLFLRDTDGDGRADRTEKLFTGFGEGNQQHRANGLQWGLDGWLHMSNGDSGGKIASARAPGVVTDIGQRDFRLHIDEGRIEMLAGRSQVGRNRDDWGNWFGCNNSNPVWHYALEEHYLRRNPHLAPPNSTVSVSNPPGAAPVFPRSQTLARFNDPHGFNHITSAAGVMIYRDDWLGREYAGNAFVSESVHNLVHREVVRPVGVTFASQRAPGEQSAEFFASTDNWARPVAIRTGPDGALYIVDMYRLVIEHPKWIPDAWQKQLGNLRAGDDMGRIYRVRPKGATLRPVPRLDRMDVRALVASLDTPNGTVRDLVHQQLVWRKDPESVPALETFFASAPRPEARLQALCALDVLGKLSADMVARGLRDPHPGVRRQAIRLSESFAATTPALLPALAGLVADPNAGVRQQLAYTLGEWKDPAAGIALAKLVRANDDRFIRAAALSSSLPHAETMIAELSTGGAADDPTLIELAIVTQHAPALGRVLSAIGAGGGAGPLPQFTAMGRVLDGLQRNNTSLEKLQSSAGARLAEPLKAVDAVFALARRVASDGKAPLDQRLAAVNVLGRGRSQQNEDVQLLAGLLTPQSPVELQQAAVATLGRMNRPTIPTKLLAAWTGYGRTIRTAVLDLVMSRVQWANLLLDKIDEDPSLLPEIDATRRLALVQHSNAPLASRAAAVFNKSLDQNRQKVIDRYLSAMQSLSGDAARGAKVFADTCSACHKFGAVPGKTIGPDIAVVNDRTSNYLVTHILDPNRAVEDKYVLYTATTQDGRTLAGMQTGEAGNSITFQGLDGSEQVILRSELRSLVSTTRSLMPDGLEAAINEQAMADLVAFIAGGGVVSVKP